MVAQTPDGAPPQPTLFELGVNPDEVLLTPAEKFERFDAQNPHIYERLVGHARDWVRLTGRRRLGIAALWERLRWDLSVQSTEQSPKLDNGYKAFYARKIMAQEADLSDLFEVRKSTADEWLPPPAPGHTPPPYRPDAGERAA